MGARLVHFGTQSDSERSAVHFGAAERAALPPTVVHLGHEAKVQDSQPPVRRADEVAGMGVWQGCGGGRQQGRQHASR